MKDPPTRKTKKPHGTPPKGDSQPPHGELRPTFYNPFEVKHRQRISKSQYKILEKAFTDNPMPNGDTRQQLATQLSMTPRTIQVWFQNRRAKNKVSMGNPDPGAKGDTPPSSGDMSIMETVDREIEHTDHHENDTPMFIQELFSQGSEPDLDDNALNIDMRSDIALSPEFFSGTLPNAPVQGDTMAISSPWDLHEHWTTTREHQVPPVPNLVQAAQTFSSSGNGALTVSLPKVEEEWPTGVILDQDDAPTRPITRSISFQLPDLQETARPKSTIHLVRRMSMPANIGRMFNLDDITSDDKGQPFQPFTRDLSATRTPLDNFARAHTSSSYPQTMSPSDSQEDAAIYRLQQQLEEQLHVQQMPHEDRNQLQTYLPFPQSYNPGLHMTETQIQQAPSHLPMDPTIQYYTSVNVQESTEKTKKRDAHPRIHGSEPGPRPISEPYQLPQLQTPRMLAQLQHQLEHQSWKRTRTIHSVARSRLSLPATLRNNARRYSEPGNVLAGLMPPTMYSGPGQGSDIGSMTSASSLLPLGQLTSQQALSTMDYGKDTLAKMRALSSMFPKALPPLDTSMSSYTPSIGTSSGGSTPFDSVGPTTPSTISSSPTSSISSSSSMTTSPFSDLNKSQLFVFATYSPSSNNDGPNEAMPLPFVALDRGSLEMAPLLMRGHSLDSMTWQPEQQKPPLLASTSRRHSQILSSPTSPHPLQQQHVQQQYQLQQHQLNIQQAQYQQFIQEQHLSHGGLTSQLLAPNLAIMAQGPPFAQDALGIHPLDQPNWPLPIFDNSPLQPSSASSEQIQPTTNIPVTNSLEPHVNGDSEYSLQHFPSVGHFDSQLQQQSPRQQRLSQLSQQQQPPVQQQKQVHPLAPSPVSLQPVLQLPNTLPPQPSPSTVRQRKQPAKRLHRSHSISVTPSAPYHHCPTPKEIIEAYKHEAFVREHQRQQRESEQQRRM
ncbi:hypothetical protein CPB97_009019 [Podila verticillata]|nr:hypothetical protein CPB97_009019 [Podila verticillata]